MSALCKQFSVKSQARSNCRPGDGWQGVLRSSQRFSWLGLLPEAFYLQDWAHLRCCYPIFPHLPLNGNLQSLLQELFGGAEEGVVLT
jgi:hypothetical protein